MRIRAIALFLLGIPLLAQENLPVTAPLTMTGDLAAAMVNGIHHFLDRETAAAPQNRARFWHRDYTSPEAYAKSVEANRERLRIIIGAVDARAPFHAVSLLSDTNADSVIAKGSGYRIHAVRWPVFDGVTV